MLNKKEEYRDAVNAGNSGSTARVNDAIEEAIRLKGAAPKNKVQNSVLYEIMHKTLIEKFQMMYDCFFKIIRDRLSLLQRNYKG